MPRTFFAPVALLASLAVMGPLSAPGIAQTVRQPRPGFNLFSVQQDVEIGRQSSVEAERQLRNWERNLAVDYDEAELVIDDEERD
jgi:hypothetical protein